MAISKRQTTEQRRAKVAWQDVSEAKDKVGKGDQSEYKTRAKNLPAMIQINGLGTAMAFLKSKPSKDAYQLIYRHLSKWVTSEGKYDDLMDMIRDVDMATYRRATTEAIEYAIWLKRYVESWGDVKESEDG